MHAVLALMYPSSKAASPSSRSHYDHSRWHRSPSASRASRRTDASVGHTRIWDKRLRRHAVVCISRPTDARTGHHLRRSRRILTMLWRWKKDRREGICVDWSNQGAKMRARRSPSPASCSRCAAWVRHLGQRYQVLQCAAVDQLLHCDDVQGVDVLS